MSDKPTYYTICPAEVRFDKRLNLISRLVYTDLYTLSNNDSGYCYVGSSKIAKWYGVSRSTISRAIKQLEDLSYIRVQRVRKSNLHQKNHIYINDSMVLHTRNTKRKGVAQMNVGCPTDAQKVLRPCDSTNTSNTNTSEYISNQEFKPRKAYDEKTGTFVGNGMMDYLKQQGIMKDG